MQTNTAVNWIASNINEIRNGNLPKTNLKIVIAVLVQRQRSLCSIKKPIPNIANTNKHTHILLNRHFINTVRNLNMVHLLKGNLQEA